MNHAVTLVGKQLPASVKHGIKQQVTRAYRRTVAGLVRPIFFMDLISTTNNFGDLTWLGQPIWQNTLDLWNIQEAIFQVKPKVLIECGTNRGGSAMYYANLFDLMGSGSVITIDIAKMHDLTHPRVTFITGCSSVDVEVVERVRSAIGTQEPVMVILDSDHSADHVSKELETYAGFVTPGSFLLVQDGVQDVLPIFFGSGPGPLTATRKFLARHPEFMVDRARSKRFIITHHPMGWLRRLPVSLDGVDRRSVAEAVAT